MSNVIITYLKIKGMELRDKAICAITAGQVAVKLCTQVQLIPKPKLEPTEFHTST
jgi:hypothetical protein